MKKFIGFALLVISIIIVSSCGNHMAEETENTILTEEMVKTTYTQITAEQAKELMEHESEYVILDTRTQAEYDESHIPGAILLPDYEVAEKAQSVLLDKEQLILVYCRSGRRSKIASQILADLGYSNVKEFGGIMDWPYDVE